MLGVSPDFVASPDLDGNTSRVPAARAIRGACCESISVDGFEPWEGGAGDHIRPGTDRLMETARQLPERRQL